MTKKEIYERVVQLTGELAQTKVAQRIFNAAMQGDAQKTQVIIDAFPEYYPELYQKIASFAEEFNKLVGDSKEDEKKWKCFEINGAWLMRELVRSKVVEEAINAANTGDVTKLKGFVDAFKKEKPGCSEALERFQKEFAEYDAERPNGMEGAIFGKETDKENGLFIFDSSIIDPLSFYVLCIFGKISDLRFLYDYDWDKEYEPENENEESEDEWFHDEYIEAIKNATNEHFAEYVACYNIADWIEDDEESVGEILVAALAGEFEDEVEEDAQTS